MNAQVAEKRPNPTVVRAQERSLGQFLADTRMNKGVSTDDVVKETRIPAHYLKMIENNSYSLISDQLYLVPFLRRYAAFLGLDPEDIASRFVHEVQRAEGSATRMPDPIEMASRKKRVRLGRIVTAAIVAAILVGLGDLVWRVYGDTIMRAITPPHAASETPQSSLVQNPAEPLPVESEPPAPASRPPGEDPG